jgi:hypothetical protein
VENPPNTPASGIIAWGSPCSENDSSRVIKVSVYFSAIVMRIRHTPSLTTYATYQSLSETPLSCPCKSIYFPAKSFPASTCHATRNPLKSIPYSNTMRQNQIPTYHLLPTPPGRMGSGQTVSAYVGTPRSTSQRESVLFQNKGVRVPCGYIICPPS